MFWNLLMDIHLWFGIFFVIIAPFEVTWFQERYTLASSCNLILFCPHFLHGSISNCISNSAHRKVVWKKSMQPSRYLLPDNLILYLLHHFELFLSYFVIIYTAQVNMKVTHISMNISRKTELAWWLRGLYKYLLHFIFKELCIE